MSKNAKASKRSFDAKQSHMRSDRNKRKDAEASAVASEIARKASGGSAKSKADAAAPRRSSSETKALADAKRVVNGMLGGGAAPLSDRSASPLAPDVAQAWRFGAASSPSVE